LNVISGSEELCASELSDGDDGPDDLSISGRERPIELTEVMDSKASQLTVKQATKLKAVVQRFAGVFADKPGCAVGFEYSIRLKPDARPVAQHPYRLSPIHKQLLQQGVRQMLADDLIEPASQEWASPVIVIPKSDGTARTVIDYRKCNTMIEGDTFPWLEWTTC
jgi:hypothetical protein